VAMVAPLQENEVMSVDELQSLLKTHAGVMRQQGDLQLIAWFTTGRMLYRACRVSMRTGVGCDMRTDRPWI